MVDLITETLDNLDVGQVEKVLAKLIGYESLPPTAKEIIEDDYFLGKTYTSGGYLYPMWRERLEEVFPDRIRTSKSVLVCGGCIGSGKSYFSQLVLQIDLIRLSFVSDPYKFFNMDRNNPFIFRYFNVDKAKAHAVLLNPTLGILESSPYIQERRKKTGEYYPHNIRFGVAKRAKDVISEALIGALISEINFFRVDQAEDILSTVLSRLGSRFQKGIHLFNHVILDSSDTHEESVVQRFVQSGKFADDIRVFTSTLWQSKAHLNLYFNNDPPSFKVYLGDATKRPFIIEHDEQLNNLQLDKDRVLVVPSELKNLFQTDIIKALQETAGISVKTNEDFFGDRDRVKAAMTLEPISEEDVITLDFYDDESLFDRLGLAKVLAVLPEDRKIVARLDLGLTHDNAGIAIGYCDKGDWDILDKKKSFKGTYHIPIAIALSRLAGQETSIRKITNFFIELSSYRDLAMVTTDQYQSSSIRQELTKAGIAAKLLSVDSNDNCYNLYKNLVYQGRVFLPNSQLVFHEICNLYHNGRKVDHRSFSTKDINDAIAGVVGSLYDMGANGLNVATQKVKDQYLQVLQNLAAQRERKSILSKFGQGMR